MENFTFFNPTRIEFGADKEQLIGQHLARHGVRKVLLCYGSERIKRDGLFDVVTQRLAEQGIAFRRAGRHRQQPAAVHGAGGHRPGRAQQVDAILSVGGGSVLDSVKAIAAGVAMPAMSGTCSRPGPHRWRIAGVRHPDPGGDRQRMNCSAVVTNDETQESFFITAPAVFLKLSIVNPRLMQSVSREYLVYSAADVIAFHRGHFTATVHPRLQSRLVEAGDQHHHRDDRNPAGQSGR